MKVYSLADAITFVKFLKNLCLRDPIICHEW